MILEAAIACMLLIHVDPVKKTVHTQSRGCAIEQHVTAEGRLMVTRTDVGRNAIITVPHRTKPFNMYYTFGEDSVCFEDGECQPVSTGWGSV